MFQNLKMGQKLTLSFVVISILASISGIISVGIMRNIDTRYSDALVNYGFAQGDVAKALSVLAWADGYVHDSISFIDEADQNAARNKLPALFEQMPQYLSDIESTLQTQETRALFSAAKSGWEIYQAKAQELVEQGHTTDVAIVTQVQKRLVNELEPIYDQVSDNLSSILSQKMEYGNSLSVTLTGFASGSVTTTIVLIIAAMVVSISFGAVITRTISKPVKACTERLKQLAMGDLDSSVPKVDSKDETGDLASATDTIVTGMKHIVKDLNYLLDAMGSGNLSAQSKAAEIYIGGFEPILQATQRISVRLSATMQQINGASGQVSTGADQVSAGSQALSQGATEQASSVQELAATINELSATVKKNAENALQAKEQVGGVAAEMEKSNEEMQEMIRAMTEISESSNEIGKIIKTIEDIAFQTNILALNAAVEAARAGAAGKGFAVVADEVRSLANKSQEASKNTSALIENSLRAVENGTQIVDRTAKTLTAAAEGAKNATEVVDKISSASEEQARSIEQVSVGVDQISSVVQTNSATAEESAATSEELSSQAQLLKNLVGQFQLRKEHVSDSFSHAPSEISFQPSKEPSGKY